MIKEIQYLFSKEGKHYFYLFLAIITTIFAIIIFSNLSYHAQHFFRLIREQIPLVAFILTPLSFMIIVYITRRYIPEAHGSGMPQILKSVEEKNTSIAHFMLSFKLAAARIILVFLALIGGGAIGIGGPSIYIGAAIFYGFYCLLNLRDNAVARKFITIGAGLGLMMVFNTPFGAIVFIVEELGRKVNKKTFIFTAIILATIYFISSSIYAQPSYFQDYSNLSLPLLSFWIIIPIAFIAGVLGVVFTRTFIYIACKTKYYSSLKMALFAMIMGLIVAILSYFSTKSIHGDGAQETLEMLTGAYFGMEFLAAKFFAVMASIFANVAGGLFVPSLTIGAAIGDTLGMFIDIDSKSLIILAMIAYFSAVIRTPLSAAILVIEMSLAFKLLLPGILVSYLAVLVAKTLQKKPIYKTLAENILNERH